MSTKPLLCIATALALATGPALSQVAEEFTCAVTRDSTLDDCTTPDHANPVRLVVDFATQTAQIGDETMLFQMQWLGEDVTGFNWLLKRGGYGVGLVTLSSTLELTATAHEPDQDAEPGKVKVSTLVAQCEPKGQ